MERAKIGRAPLIPKNPFFARDQSHAGALSLFWDEGKLCLPVPICPRFSLGKRRWHVRCCVKRTMIEGIYTAAASLSTLEKWQASISQNLASSSVAGFKKSNFAVETDDKLKPQYAPDGLSAARHTGGMPTQKTSVNFSPGDITATGKGTDLAIDGPGFFQIKGADDKNLYTRDGEFHFNSERQIYLILI